MQHCSSGSLSFLAKCNGKAFETLESVLLLGVGSSHEEGEGEEREVGEEVGEEVREEVMVVVAERKVMLVMVFDHRVKKGWPHRSHDFSSNMVCFKVGHQGS